MCMSDTSPPGLHASVCMFVYLDVYVCICIAVYAWCLARAPGVDVYVCVYVSMCVLQYIAVCSALLQGLKFSYLHASFGGML